MSLQILLDFSETDEFNDILAIRKLLLSKKESGIPVSGIIAVNMEKIDHSLIQSLAEGISQDHRVNRERNNTLVCPSHVS